MFQVRLPCPAYNSQYDTSDSECWDRRKNRDIHIELQTGDTSQDTILIKGQTYIAGVQTKCLAVQRQRLLSDRRLGQMGLCP